MNVLHPQESRKATLLSYLSAVLSHPTTDDKERGAALDILGTITMHDPSLLRRYCLNFYSSLGDSAVIDTMRPEPNDIQEVLFTVPPDDLLLSLLFIMATEVMPGYYYKQVKSLELYWIQKWVRMNTSRVLNLLVVDS